MPRYSTAILEEELKNKVASDWFAEYDTTQIVGRIDFAVAYRQPDTPQLLTAETQFLLWAEAKRGDKRDIKASLVQLVLTIGQARTFDTHLPPRFLGAFDAEKIAFLPFSSMVDTFCITDFNWNVTPSNHETREFQTLYSKIDEILQRNTYTYRFDTDERELRQFVRDNFRIGASDVSRIRINKNNFTAIYRRWRLSVMPTIDVDWRLSKRGGILDGHFFLADILSTDDNASIKQKLFVILANDHYILDRKRNDMGLYTSMRADFNDNGKAHAEFWRKYKRPPRQEYWEYFSERVDLLVPQDVREYRGEYFTPQQWVELSQQYIADELGDDWQDDYYVWDCCAGTGNLLAGLTNKHHIYASTLRQSDVDIMHDRIQNGANLLDRHVFQFDFLNDPLLDDEEKGVKSKLPKSLQDIISDPERRKKLVIYINPPYAEAGNKKAISNEQEKNKDKVARDNMVFQRYKNIGPSVNELFAQFFIRIYKEIPNSFLAEFSTLKILQAPNFAKFRDQFRAKLGRLFLVPAKTFDNVSGEFPIGFHIWHLGKHEPFISIKADVYDAKGNFIGNKEIFEPPHNRLWMDWLKTLHDKGSERIGYFRTTCSDFQNQNGTFFASQPSDNDISQRRTHDITKNNFVGMSIAFAVRLCVEATWLNDRDQFLYPNDGWQTDREFHSDCLVYTLFHGQNRISSDGGTNHWIPFTEAEVDAKELFDSHFMSDFISGKLRPAAQSQAPQQPADLFADEEEGGSHYSLLATH